MEMTDTDLESWDLILFIRIILVNTCWLLMSYSWLWRYMNLAKNHDFTEFSFYQMNLVHSGQQMLNKVVLVKNSQSATWNLEIHRFRWGRLFLLHQNFRRLPKFRPSKSRKEKHECWSLFYAIACWIMVSFALDY